MANDCKYKGSALIPILKSNINHSLIRVKFVYDIVKHKIIWFMLTYLQKIKRYLCVNETPTQYYKRLYPQL